jgi:uncharacterized membrane protein
MVPLVGLALNYTSFGIALTPILLSLISFNIIFSLLSIYRRINSREPFVPKVEIKFELGEKRLNRVLTVVLVVSIVVSVAVLGYVVATPKQGEKFTEFYILGEKGKASDYPTHLKVGQKGKLIIGIANHEHRTVNYTVEIWLVNAAYENNKTIINEMYFFDRFNVTLEHMPVDVGENWTPQWEIPYTFSIDKPGRYKMWFLLFKDGILPPSSEPEKMRDYAGTDYENRIKDAIQGEIQSLNLNVVVE